MNENDLEDGHFHGFICGHNITTRSHKHNTKSWVLLGTTYFLQINPMTVLMALSNPDLISVNC
jgi:hypothetical protein